MLQKLRALFAPPTPQTAEERYAAACASPWYPDDSDDALVLRSEWRHADQERREEIASHAEALAWANSVI